MMVHFCNPNTLESEAEKFQVQGRLELHMTNVLNEQKSYYQIINNFESFLARCWPKLFLTIGNSKHIKHYIMCS